MLKFVIWFLHFSLFFLEKIEKDENGDWFCHDLNAKEKENIHIGVSRIWVAKDCQRKQIATRLVQAMQKSYAGVKFAFTHTTTVGTKFASKYMGNKDGSFIGYMTSKK